MSLVSQKSLKELYHSQSARHAIKTAIAAVLSIIIYQYFDLPHGYWSTITAMIVMQSNIDTGSLEMTLKVASRRLMGTFVGATVALLVLFFIPFNHWQLLAIIFVIMAVFSYMNLYYDGFKLAGATALIVLLLSHHLSITHSFAFMRITEIFLGIVIAVLVTVCIWPYRIFDHLEERCLTRFRSILQLFLDFSKHKKGSQSQALDVVFKGLEDDIKMVGMVKKSFREQQRKRLVIEKQFVKALYDLNHSYLKLPGLYWEYAPLKDSTPMLLRSLADVIEAIAEGGCKDAQDERLRKCWEQHKNAFSGFRVYRKKMGVNSLSLDDSYHVINSFNALRRCVNQLCSLCK